MFVFLHFYAIITILLLEIGLKTTTLLFIAILAWDNLSSSKVCYCDIVVTMSLVVTFALNMRHDKQIHSFYALILHHYINWSFLMTPAKVNKQHGVTFTARSWTLSAWLQTSQEWLLSVIVYHTRTKCSDRKSQLRAAAPLSIPT